MKKKEYQSESPEETQRLAASMLTWIKPGDVILLQGNLGAGKTCFIQGLARALDYTGTASSPTYMLIQEYHTPSYPLFHIDLYRLDSQMDVLSLGLDDYMYGPGVTCIEWPERLPDLAEEAHWVIHFEPGTHSQSRQITLTDLQGDRF